MSNLKDAEAPTTGGDRCENILAESSGASSGSAPFTSIRGSFMAAWASEEVGVVDVGIVNDWVGALCPPGPPDDL